MHFTCKSNGLSSTHTTWEDEDLLCYIQNMRNTDWMYSNLCASLFCNSVLKNQRKCLFWSTSRQPVEEELLDRSTTPLSFPLSALSSLGLHDQSLFLLTELQTAWNQDEIGLQTEANLSLFISLHLSPSLSYPPAHTQKDESKHVLSYLWKSANILFLAEFFSNLNVSLLPLFLNP